MGLTVHFSFSAPPVTDEQTALNYIKKLHSFCEDRPFAKVDAIVHLKGKFECDYDHSDKDDPHRWMKIQSRASLNRTQTHDHPDGNDLHWGYSVGSKVHIGRTVKPIEIIGFTAWPGGGCETMEIGLVRFPDTISFYDDRYTQLPKYRTLKTRMGGQWRWGAFCKTQYASEKGLPHFLRCHLLVISVLDKAKELGILKRVSDEGGYWRNRRLDTLSEKVGSYNAMIGAFSRALKGIVPTGAEVQSEIENHPDYKQFTVENLVANFPEMHAAVARTIDLMKKSLRQPARWSVWSMSFAT